MDSILHAVRVEYRACHIHATGRTAPPIERGLVALRRTFAETRGRVYPMMDERIFLTLVTSVLWRLCGALFLKLVVDRLRCKKEWRS